MKFFTLILAAAAAVGASAELFHPNGLQLNDDAAFTPHPPTPNGPDEPAQPYNGTYWKSITPGLKGPALKDALGKLINPHTAESYKFLWSAFKVTDEMEPNMNCTKDQIFDIYSLNCWTPGTDQCGSYKTEGDCYNREHSWPKSWWGGMSKGHHAQTDLFHLYPTDGYVNNRRSSFPYGIVDKPTYTSKDGSKLGPCTAAGNYTGTCFEPIDHFKGDLARSYFYIATAYAGKFDCCDEAGVNKANIKPWLESILRKWHVMDPPDRKESDRAHLIFTKYQKNRNPYIDHPEWVSLITDF